MKLRVIDGDTFDADFNRNWRFSNPQERVWLLYVDIPELKKFNSCEKTRSFIFLEHKRMKKGLPVIIFENLQNWLGLQKIRKSDLSQIEGFVTLYKKAVAN